MMVRRGKEKRARKERETPLAVEAENEVASCVQQVTLMEAGQQGLEAVLTCSTMSLMLARQPGQKLHKPGQQQSSSCPLKPAQQQSPEPPRPAK
eukprot:1137554-Pelagomonas_calceolata.AAC.12